MSGERPQNDEMVTIALRTKKEQGEALKEVARREEFGTVTELVRETLGSFIGQYAEAHADFRDFLHVIAREALSSRVTELQMLLGETSLYGLELFPKPEDPSSQG